MRIISFIFLITIFISSPIWSQTSIGGGGPDGPDDSTLSPQQKIKLKELKALWAHLLIHTQKKWVECRFPMSAIENNPIKDIQSLLDYLAVKKVNIPHAVNSLPVCVDDSDEQKINFNLEQGCVLDHQSVLIIQEILKKQSQDSLYLMDLFSSPEDQQAAVKTLKALIEN